MITVSPVPKSRFLVRLVPYIGMFLLALLLWLPFGFKATGLIEELGINELLDKGEQLFFVTPSSPMSFVRTRPLQMFTFALAYALDHDSYRFYNILMMLFLFGKMVVVYGLVQQFLPGKKLLAFVMGVLFALYPSDTGLFALRTIHIHCATLAYLIAVYLLIEFGKRQGRKGWMALIGAIIFLIFSLWQYQIALVAAVLTPFLLLYFTRPNRRFWIGTGIWYAAMVAVLLYALWANGQSTVTSYEGSLLPLAQLNVDGFVLMLKALGVGYQRQVISWAGIFNKLPSLGLYGVYVLIGMVISAGIGGYLIWRQRTEADNQPISWRRYGLLLVGAIAWFAIGVATYLPIPTHRFQDFRIYLLSILGSALVLTLTLYLISLLMKRYRETVFVIFTLPFIGLALLNAFTQQQYYVDYSLIQQHILQQVVAQAPQIKPGTSVVILDSANAFKDDYILYYGVYWQTILRYIYDDSNMVGIYCQGDGSGIFTSKNCQASKNELQVHLDNTTSLTLDPPRDLTVPYDQMLLFTTEPGWRLKLLSAEEAAATFNISGYDPQAHIIDGALPYRTTTMFSCDPALTCYRSGSTDNTFNFPKLH